jgi:hypothetical protein
MFVSGGAAMRKMGVSEALMALDEPVAPLQEWLVEIHEPIGGMENVE